MVDDCCTVVWGESSLRDAAEDEPELARYNDPWTPGFLRTNEIWVVVDEASANAAASAPP